MSYDSSKETMRHKKILNFIANTEILPKLLERYHHHDESKLMDAEEKAGYDYYVPLLNEVKYGTEEYRNIREQMNKNCFALHAKHNSHHPEHYPDGINNMDLFDLIEMFTDWLSASMVSDTEFKKGLEFNIERFDISPQLASILRNTYFRYFKEFDVPEDLKKLQREGE